MQVMILKGSLNVNSKFKDSVTAVFLVQDRVLLLERAEHLRAFPGFTSFVGGKVDAEDDKSAVIPNTTELDDRFINALVREVQEEVGFNLVKQEAQIKRLTFLGTATTPNFQKVRFKNHYVLVELAEEFSAIDDAGEIKSSRWLSLDQFFQEDCKGQHMMVPPSREVLRRLQKGEANPHHDLDIEIHEDCVPAIEFVQGLLQIMPLSNTFPPANRTNCFYFGQPKLLVDPSPKNAEELKKFLNTLQGHQVDKVFLTHHHPDHHEFAPEVAGHFQVPIVMSQLTCDLIQSKHGEDYFKDVSIEIARQGDILGTWHDQKIVVLEVPGHASGQLALVTESPMLAIVSDLIQSVGTVLVAPPNGNMQDYFESLQRMIQRADRYILPSHGLPLGGVHRLEKTLQHRLQREHDIRQLLAKGKTLDEIVATIYSELDARLLPFAKGTVQAHIVKIEKESTSL